MSPMTEPIGFEILYEEGPCLIIAKPAGVLTQAPPGIDSLEVRVKRFLKIRDEKPGKVYLAIIHRLDRPVSGVMVTAKHVRAAKRLSEQFEGRTVDKKYWAVVAGDVPEDSGQWVDFVRKVPNEARSEVTTEDAPGARRAALRYQVRGRGGGCTWLEIELETGRTHQIRLQAGSRGFAVLGDSQYGSTEDFGPPTDDQRQRCIALHAQTLGLEHPMTRQPVSIAQPPPDYWQAVSIAELQAAIQQG